MSPLQNSPSSVDQEDLHRELRAAGILYSKLVRPTAIRPLLDIGFDWTVILSGMLALHHIGCWSWPVVTILIGNRQRALGNLLHDAAHRNLANRHNLNDGIAQVFLTPPLFNNLTLYREAHARHHAWLGNPALDPDYITPAATAESSWWPAYCSCLCSYANWLSSISGHLCAPNATFLQKFTILLWWVALLSALSCWINARFATEFFIEWMLAKATTFHAITTFREMCDHFGLRPGGIFSFTRDLSTVSPLSLWIHPRNNGYHLTHHLMPSIPYYRLHQAHAAIEKLPLYHKRASVCDAYFRGSNAVVRDWSR